MLFNPGLDTQELNFSAPFPLSYGIWIFCQPPSMQVQSIIVRWILMFQFDRQKTGSLKTCKSKTIWSFPPSEMTEAVMKRLTWLHKEGLVQKHSYTKIKAIGGFSCFFFFLALQNLNCSSFWVNWLNTLDMDMCKTETVLFSFWVKIFFKQWLITLKLPGPESAHVFPLLIEKFLILVLKHDQMKAGAAFV